MLIADLKGKLSNLKNSEDFLTSSVFSVFKYINDLWLEKYLNMAVNLEGKQLNVSIKNPKYSFWPWFTNSESCGEPDLVIYTQNSAIIIEAKNYSGKSGEGIVVDEETRMETILDQLYREYYIGEFNILGNKYKDFCVIYLTRHPHLPKEELEKTIRFIERKDVKQANKARNRLYWLNWQKACVILEQVISSISSNEIEISLSKDLLEFLERRNLGEFTGFKFLENNCYNNLILFGDEIFYRKVYRLYWDYLDNYSKLSYKEPVFYY